MNPTPIGPEKNKNLNSERLIDAGNVRQQQRQSQIPESKIEQDKKLHQELLNNQLNMVRLSVEHIRGDDSGTNLPN